MSTQRQLALQPTPVQYYRAGIWSTNTKQTQDKSMTTSGMICDTRLQT